jgi:dienelactone hydrolase
VIVTVLGQVGWCRSMRACVTSVLIGAAVCLAGSPALAQAPPYLTEQVSFASSGGLRIGALLGRPPGSGVFPAYISNHGSMTLQDAGKALWTSINPGSLTDTLVRKGYVVLIVARRGYRGSEGTTTTYTTNLTSRMAGKSAAGVMQSAEAEADDVIAALEYLLTLPCVDKERVAVGGVSLGGLVSVMAVAREPRFRALITMAGGYRQSGRGGADEAWPLVEATWQRAAARINIPPSSSGRRTT